MVVGVCVGWVGLVGEGVGAVVWVDPVDAGWCVGGVWGDGVEGLVVEEGLGLLGWCEGLWVEVLCWSVGCVGEGWLVAAGAGVGLWCVWARWGWGWRGGGLVPGFLAGHGVTVGVPYPYPYYVGV